MASIEGTDQLLARIEAMGRTQGVLREVQLRTVREAKLIVPRKTGHLGRSIVPGRLTKDSATIEARTPYAATVELGSRPHIIRPKRAKVLAWGGTRRLSGTLSRGSRATNFARVVRHPGTRAQPYLIPGAKKALAELTGALVKLWNRAA